MKTNAKNNEKLKILFVSDYPLDEVMGGSVRYLFEQSLLLAKRGHSVHVLTRKERKHGGYSSNNNIKEWKYITNNDNALCFFVSNLLNCKNLFESLFEKYSYDAINFYQPLSALGVLRSAKSKKVKKLYTCHSLSFEEYISRNYLPAGLFGHVFNWLNIIGRKRIEKKVLNSADAITVLSKFTKNRLLNIYKIAPGKISINHGGVDLKRFNPSSNGIKKIRKNLGISDNKIVIFTVRNLVNRMGLENLILAIKSIVVNAPDIRLVIGGDGPLKTDLIGLANNLGLQEFIRFVGFIHEDQLSSYYQMADLFVLPTKELEGFGLVTLEAMASGLPVLGTPVGGTKEILGNFDSRFLFKGTDSNSIAELILENYDLIKQNPQRWEEISLRCRKFVEHNYSWEKNIDALEELFA